jgi:hypothetical protein
MQSRSGLSGPALLSAVVVQSGHLVEATEGDFMKLLLNGEVQAEGGIFSATAGAGCDEISLNLQDVMHLHRLASSGSEVQRSHLAGIFSDLAMKFVP